MSAPERSLLLANSYRYMNFNESYGHGFLDANVPRDLHTIFTDGNNLPRFSRLRKHVTISTEATDTHPPINIDVTKNRSQWWKASIVDDMTAPGAPVAAVTMMMYYRKHGYDETGNGSVPRVVDRYLHDHHDSEWPAGLRAHNPLHPVLAHLNEGKGYRASIYDIPQRETDFPTALYNLASEYSMIYRCDGTIPVARMIGASSLDAFAGAWQVAEERETPVLAARTLLHSGVFAPEQ